MRTCEPSKFEHTYRDGTLELPVPVTRRNDRRSSDWCDERLPSTDGSSGRDTVSSVTVSSHHCSHSHATTLPRAIAIAPCAQRVAWITVVDLCVYLVNARITVYTLLYVYCYGHVPRRECSGCEKQKLALPNSVRFDDRLSLRYTTIVDCASPHARGVYV